MAWTQHISDFQFQDPYRCVSVGHKLYAFKCSEEGYYPEYIAVFIFDTLTYSHCCHSFILNEGKSQFYHLAISFVVAVSKKIYLFGPVSQERLNVIEMYCFDTETFKWEYIDTGRGVAVHYFQCVCAYEQTIFSCVKTNRWNGNEEQQSIYALDLSTNKWKCVSKNSWSKKYDAISAFMRGSILYVVLSKSCQSRGKIGLFDTLTEHWQWIEDSQGVPLPPLAKWLVFVHEDFLYVFADQFFHFNIKPQWKIYRYCMKDNWWDEIEIERTPTNACFTDLVAMDSKVYFFSSEPRGIFVLDFSPSLINLCFRAVCDYKLDTSILPNTLKREAKYFMW